MSELRQSPPRDCFQSDNFSITEAETPTANVAVANHLNVFIWFSFYKTLAYFTRRAEFRNKVRSDFGYFGKCDHFP
ncbi:hypothetical protein [Necropsobacter massiliensis]|uniref:hypothetical protein n=1 Tax=Necropsobacter massiliensis TaxID=1400001 RepID=UPI00117DBCB7|nr:hypothetical protein [Necropsobacter massiliensis]